MKASTQPAPTRRTHLWVALALCAITLLAYSNSFSAGFTFDNHGLILEDPRIREASDANLHLIAEHTYWWPYGESGLYRPLTTLSYLFNYAILGNGDQPAGYHAVNLLLHAGNVLLVLLLARKLLGSTWPPVFIAALWAVHPVLTESVTNIVGRADLLAGGATLGGFLMYVKSAETAGGRRWAWLGGLMLATSAGVFSKESAVTVVGVIALYEVIGPRRWWALALGAAAALIPIVVMLQQRAAVMAKVPPAFFPAWDNPIGMAGFWTAKLTALKVCALYLARLLWPWHLSCDYSFDQIPLFSGGDWMALAAVAVAVAGAAALYWVHRTAFFVVGAAAVTFLPTSNLLFPMGTIMAERFLYLPAIACAFLVVLGLDALGRRLRNPRLAPAVVGAVVLVLAARTWARNADWHDQVSLMTATVGSSPASFKSHMVLAAALFDASPANTDRAISEIEKSLAILAPLPDARQSPAPYDLAGMLYMAKGDARRAIDVLTHCRTIVFATVQEEAAAARAGGRMVPEVDNVRVGALERTVSEAALQLKDVPRAIEAAGSAIDSDPLNPAGYHRLAAAYQAADRLDDAAVALVEGALITSDMGLRQELLEHYQHGLDPSGCATQPGPNGPAINMACPIVQQHTCAGVAAAMRVFVKMNRRDAAERLQASVIAAKGCPAGPLDAALR